jgi:membrane-associated protease RseP (regulator of RpoE activity)
VGPRARPHRDRRDVGRLADHRPTQRRPELSTLLTILGIVAFAVGLLFSIAFHEGGHFLWARRYGMRVPQFMVGFGPTIWSRKRGETEYGVKAIPLGGYIRIVGMIPPAEEGESRRATRMRSFIAEVRGAALNDVLPTDGDRVFYAKPWWQRVVVMFAGPFHNLVLAVVFFAVTLAGIGTTVVSTTIGTVPACVLPATAGAHAKCTTPVDTHGHPCTVGTAGCSMPAESPAAKAGLRPGDTIVAIGGEPLDPSGYSSWTTLTDEIRSHPGRSLQLTVDRHGQRREVTVTPIANTVYAEAGSDRTTTAGYLGISATERFARQPISALPGYFGMVATQSLDKLAGIPQRIPQVFSAAFLGAKRDVNGPVGVVGVGRISGEIFAAQKISGLEKLSFFLSLLASVNLVLFLFNLLPIYPLDGGHIAGALYERVRAAVAHRRGRPDPGPFDIARLMPVAYVVAGAFLVLSALLVVADIVNPIQL